MSLRTLINHALRGLDQHPDTVRLHWLMKHVDTTRPGMARLCVTFTVNQEGQTFTTQLDRAIQQNPEGPSNASW